MDPLHMGEKVPARRNIHDRGHQGCRVGDGIPGRPKISVQQMTRFSLIFFLSAPFVVNASTSNVFLQWAQSSADALQQGDPYWVCGSLPIANTTELPWWVSPLQGKDWIFLQSFLGSLKQWTRVQMTGVTRQNISEWPINKTLNELGHDKPFSVNETRDKVTAFATPLLDTRVLVQTFRPRNTQYRNGFLQICDGYIWLTATKGHLSQIAPLCWEQRNHSLDSWPNTTRVMGWIPPGECRHTIVLQQRDLFATDWSRRPGLNWYAPNGTQWLYGSNLWPWLPSGWLGRCTLGIPWAQGRWVKTMEVYPYLPHMVDRWTRAIVHRNDHLPTIFMPSVGLGTVVQHIEALASFTQRALNESLQSISLMNAEVYYMHKAILQNRMALDILTAAEGGTCALIKTECCVYIPNNSGNISLTLEDMRRQIQAISSSALSLHDWMASQFSGRLSWWQKILIVLATLWGVGIALCRGLYFCHMFFQRIPQTHSIIFQQELPLSPPKSGALPALKRHIPL